MDVEAEALKLKQKFSASQFSMKKINGLRSG